MSRARYFIYRNLHKSTFSIKYKGKVIDYCDCFMTNDVEFRVSAKGSTRAKDNKERNVHAYAVVAKEPCNAYGISMQAQRDFEEDWEQITYDPFKNNCFVWKTDNKPITENVKDVHFHGTKVYGKRI